MEFSGATAYESNPVVQTNDNVLVGGGDVTLTAKNKEYYKFVGWYLGNKKVSDDVQFSVRSADDKLSYTGLFALRNMMKRVNKLPLRCRRVPVIRLWVGTMAYKNFLNCLLILLQYPRM